MGWSSFCWNRIEVGGLSCARAVLEVVEEDSKYGGETVNRKGQEEVSRRKSVRAQPFFGSLRGLGG
jgi:hypothetical protein